MPEGTEHARFLREYLLGQAPRDARESFEQRYLADDDLFEELVAAENDLIDSFVRGALSPEERAQFQSHYLSTPERRERVAFAHSLMDYTSSGPASNSPAAAPPRSAFFRSPVWAIAAGILLMISAAAAWWNLQLRRQVQDAAALQQELRQQIQALAGRVGATPWPAPGPGKTLVAVTLSPELSRGVGSGNVLVIPPGASEAFVFLNRQPGGYSSYKVTAENVEGSQIWSETDLPSNTAGTATLIAVKLPPALMRTGDYILKLTGITRDGKSEDLEEYTLRILVR